MRYFLWMLTAAVLVTGCQGPFLTGGFPEGVPYRGYGVDGPGPGVLGNAPEAYTAMPSPMGPSPMAMHGVPGSPGPQDMRGPGSPMMSGYQPMSLHGAPLPPTGQGPMQGPATSGMGPVAPGMMVAAPGMGGKMPAGVPMLIPAGMDGPVPPRATPVMTAPSSQINFLGPDGLTIYWNETARGAFDSEPCIVPGTHDFPQGGIYRLKLTGIPGEPGAELYPTLEVAPTMARTQAYLAHCPVPIEFTANDFAQAFSGNLVTKVVYLPNPEFQSLAMAGVGTLVNTQLEAGVDPVEEAARRGAILAIIRLGNKDLGASAKQVEAKAANGQGQMILKPMGGQPVVPGMMSPAMMSPAVNQMPGSYTMNGSTIPQNAISGVNIPPYGTPMTKTTTGIPGPPQLPQGRHATNRYPVVRAEPIPVPPVPGATLVQPQPYGMPVALPPDVFLAPQPQL